MISTHLRGGYERNAETLVQFYALQGDYAAALARRPEAIRLWLDRRSRPVPTAEGRDRPSAADGWRTSRLSGRRCRELGLLLNAREEEKESSAERLATWLRACLPVLSLLEIGDCCRQPEGKTAQLGADQTLANLMEGVVAQREAVFLANYGLAKAAAGQGHPEGFDDRLSAACAGLLDAIDRYVPGERAARFSYFATYWIRYQISRQNQKFGGVIAFPIYQQRIVRKIAQLTQARRDQGLGEASQAEVCAALEVGADAYYRHRQKPTVLSLEAPPAGDEADGGLEHLLCDPGPGPVAELEEGDVASRINGWLKRSFPPATRVMLAYAHDLGPLAEAAAEYLTHLREIARERLRTAAP